MNHVSLQSASMYPRSFPLKFADARIPTPHPPRSGSKGRLWIPHSGPHLRTRCQARRVPLQMNLHVIENQIQEICDLNFEVPVLDCTDAKFESAWHLLNVPPFARRQMKIFCKCSPHVCVSLVTVLQFSRSEFRQDCRELLRTKDAERKPEEDRRKK